MASKEFIVAVKELLDSSKLFLDGDIVTETTGTIPLTERLRSAIKKTDDLISRGV